MELSNKYSFCDKYSEKGGYRNSYVHIHIPMTMWRYEIRLEAWDGSKLVSKIAKTVYFKVFMKLNKGSGRHTGCESSIYSLLLPLIRCLIRYELGTKCDWQMVTEMVTDFCEALFF